jgi:hypothetical protein
MSDHFKAGYRYKHRGLTETQRVDRIRELLAESVEAHQISEHESVVLFLAALKAIAEAWEK